MTNEPYMIIESGVTPLEKQNEPLSFRFSSWYTIGRNMVVPDRSIEGPLFEALLWDYFCQHFYEWVSL